MLLLKLKDSSTMIQIHPIRNGIKQLMRILGANIKRVVGNLYMFFTGFTVCRDMLIDWGQKPRT